MMTAKRGRGRPAKLTVETVGRALAASYGVKADAARRLKVARYTVSAYCDRHAELRAIVVEANETLLDLAESAIVKTIKSGSRDAWRAAAFVLRARGKARGWSITMVEIQPPKPPAPSLAHLSSDELHDRVATLEKMREKVERGEELTLGELALLAAGEPGHA